MSINSRVQKSNPNHKEPTMIRSIKLCGYRGLTLEPYVACKCDGFMCYGPLVPDGYATCYNPRDNDVNFATAAFVSNPVTSCEKYRKALEQSLQDMHDVLVQNIKSKL